MTLDVARIRKGNQESHEFLRDEAGRARLVCDYIAGMTDRFAIEEHKKLFNLDVWS